MTQRVIKGNVTQITVALKYLQTDGTKSPVSNLPSALTISAALTLKGAAVAQITVADGDINRDDPIVGSVTFTIPSNDMRVTAGLYDLAIEAVFTDPSDITEWILPGAIEVIPDQIIPSP